ncbi:MAG TPA: histidinol dehydrogenase [Sphingobacteriaceae bacterium]|nr:histidinol dehydrogenase [Sphingobacteriaceae bacterium]
MLKILYLKDFTKQQIEELCKRNSDDTHIVNDRVLEIISEVKTDGDKALIKFARQFDQVESNTLFLEGDELTKLASTVSEVEKKALDTAYSNIKKFHLPQLKAEDKIETMTGVTCWREHRAIEKVGLYIPGGTAVLPSTFLMLGIPARIVGCNEIIVCTPPQADGNINKYIAYCAQLLGINRVYLTGGAQAIAAMAYGTETIPKVDKIFGPGNQYVTRAKTIIQSTTNTAIDMPAGPSEVLVIADDSARPEFVAADLLAQAEHGPDSQSILVCTSTDILEQTLQQLEMQLKELPRAEIAAKALSGSYAVKVNTVEEALSFSNVYAPEHLILEIDEWEKILPLIINAGSVFAGHFTPESAGDYASGTNHTLPTSSYARAYSGVSVDSFVKKITFQHITNEGIKNIGSTVEVLADLEGLQAHKNAVSIRLKD